MWELVVFAATLFGVMLGIVLAWWAVFAVVVLLVLISSKVWRKVVEW